MDFGDVRFEFGGAYDLRLEERLSQRFKNELKHVYVLWSVIEVLFSDALVFYIGSVINLLLFLKLAFDWEVIEREWLEFEKSVKHYEIPDDLPYIIKKITIIFMSIALLEHGLFLTVEFSHAYQRDRSFLSCLEKFFVNSYLDWFESLTEYSLWKGILLEICDIQRTFIWTFADVFIILLSIALKSKLNQITLKIQQLIAAKVADFYVWKTIRENYGKIYDLNQLLNEKISWLIFCSFVLNLYFILIQLNSTLKPIRGTVRRVYFYVSFLLIIMRLVCVCLYCGQVYEKVRNLVTVINQLPSNIYNLEVSPNLPKLPLIVE